MRPHRILWVAAAAALACAPLKAVHARRRRDMRDIRTALNRLERAQEELVRRQHALDKQEHNLMDIICPNGTPLQGLPTNICTKLNASTTASGATTRTLDRENRARTAAIVVCCLKAALAVWVIGLFL